MLPGRTVPLANPILLDIVPAATDARRGRVIYIDAYGNAMTNVPSDAVHLADARSIMVNGHQLGTLKGTYSDALPGQPLALIGSSDLLEIAVREGSAAAQLQIKIGDEVRLDGA